MLLPNDKSPVYRKTKNLDLSRLKALDFGLTLYQMTESWTGWTVQLESICRQKNKCELNIELKFWKGRKHCGKRRKCWLPAFYPFPTLFSKGLCFRVDKSWDCVVKS